MSLVFNMHAVSSLSQSLSETGTTMYINSSDYNNFLSGHSSGDYFYCLLRDATQKEIVKVEITGSSASLGIQITRGQQGTSSPSGGWPTGALVYQDITATDLDNLYQKAVFRTIDYNPNGVLAPSFKGEKVYQSDTARWWKSIDGTNSVWKCVAGHGFGENGDISVFWPRDINGDDDYRYVVHYPGSLRALSHSGASISQVGATLTGLTNPFAVYADGDYIYVVNETVPPNLYALSFDGSTFTAEDNIQIGTSTDLYDSVDNEDLPYIDGDGDYIYVPYLGDGLFGYSFNGTTITEAGSIDSGGSARDVCCLGGVVFLANGTDGIRAYTFDGATFTGAGHLSGVNAVKIAADDNYVYIVDAIVEELDYYLRAYTYSGGTFTLVDSYHIENSNISSIHSYYNILCVGGYTTSYVSWFLKVSGGVFVLKKTIAQSGTTIVQGIWSYGENVYLCDLDNGVVAYEYI